MNWMWNKWVSTKEALPDVGEMVLAYDARLKYMAIAELGIKGIFYDVNDSEGHDIEPTHWTSLPEPPKGDE